MIRSPSQGFRRTAGALLVLTLAACDAPAGRPAVSPDSASARAPGSPDASGPQAPVSLRDYIAQAAHAHGRTRAEVAALLGAPDSVRAVATPNRHDPAVTDSVVTLFYPRTRYEYYVVTQGPGEILDAAVIGSNEHLRHASPGIGATPDEVRTAFGSPMRSAGDTLEYECTTCEVPEPVTFVIADGRVVRIEFDYYVD